MTNETKLVVYFGPGFCVLGTPAGPKIRDGCRYLGIELGDRFEGIYGLEVSKSQVSNPRIELLQKDAKDSGINSSSVDEVHIHNVFGAPRIKGKGDFLLEAARIVKPQGIILVGETRTPDLFPIRRLLTLAVKRNGLECEVLFNGQENTLMHGDRTLVYENIGGWYRNMCSIDPRSYMLRLTRR
jgi:hypothetical protein